MWTRIDPAPLREDVDGARWYRIPDDPHCRRVPAVSTVLAQTDTRRWALERWRENLGTQNADRITAIAAKRGEVMHASIAKFLCEGGEPERTVWWRSIELVVRQLAHAAEHLLCEGAVFQTLHGFAGTPDDVFRMAGELWVVDWKTGVEPYPPPKLERCEEQVAGYSEAIGEQYGERPTRGLVVVALPRQRAQVHTVAMAEAWARWQTRISGFYEGLE